MVIQNFLTQQIIEILKNEKTIKFHGSLNFNDITKRVRKHNKNKKLGSFQETLEAVYNALYELNHSGIVRQANGRWRLTNIGSKFKTNEKKPPVLFTLLTYQKKSSKKLSIGNLVYQRWVFAQLANGNILWGAIQSESEVEAIVTNWRSGRLTSIDSPLLHNTTEQAMSHLAGVRVGFSSQIVSLFGVKLNGGELYTRLTEQASWEKRGVIIKYQIIPFLPSRWEKSAKQPIKPIKNKKNMENLPKPATSTQNNLTQHYSATHLNWEVLPPGWWNNHKEYTRDKGILRQGLNHDDIERLKFIDSLMPEKWFVAKNYLGRRSYYVAVFPTCVIAESAEYGNAAYIVRDTTDWRSILNRTKRQVIQLGPTIVTRIRHVHNASSRIATIVGKD